MKVLLVPSIRASLGSGHLKRALPLAAVFGPDSALLLEDLDQALGRSAQDLLRPLGIETTACRFIEHLDPKEPWDLVIVDRRSSTADQIRRFLPTPVVGLDEGGAGRRYCSYLIDTLPVCGSPQRPNRSALSLLDLPARRSRERFPFEKVLLSFGGEDPEDLSGRLLEVLLRKPYFDREQITVVQGPYFKRERWPEGLRVLRSPVDLKSLLGGYDLLFCAFGLTTYEGLAAGLPVINLNPSRYHRRLSRAGGIPEIGVRLPKVHRLEKLLDRREALEVVLARHPPERFVASPRMSELPALLQPSAAAACPLCGKTADPAAARFAECSYFRCRGCGIYYMIAFGMRPEPAELYGGHYFFSEYRKQYGKTYLEDFQAIKGMAAVRLQRISAAAAGGPRLLDVGCAYGPFLQAAAEQGYRVQGLDVSPEAVRYVREQLGIPCALGDFSAEESMRVLSVGEQGLDVISMWYVIEHFRDPAGVLRRVNRLLAPGGVFAFSTPSCSGISARTNLLRFLENSPGDHFTIWSPRAAAGILRRFGFELRRIVVTGHHGQRFPWFSRLSAESLLTPGLTAISRLLRLGDTFEAYAVKVRDLP